MFQRYPIHSFLYGINIPTTCCIDTPIFHRPEAGIGRKHSHPDMTPESTPKSTLLLPSKIPSACFSNPVLLIFQLDCEWRLFCVANLRPLRMGQMQFLTYSDSSRQQCAFLLLLFFFAAAVAAAFFSDVTAENDRVFRGESNSSRFLSTTGGSPVRDLNPRNSNPLYQTAKIFKTKKSSYHFKISGNSIYAVRLHFFPFYSQDYNLSAAVFDVSVYGVPLSRDSKLETDDDTVTIMECLLMVHGNKLEISLVPSPQKSPSFAFINAIEVFSRQGLLSDAAKLVSAKGSSKSQGLLRNLFETVYRVNVGGPKISDDLGRSWIPDDKFLTNPEAAQVANHAGPIQHGEALIPDIAPESVYRTGKQMKRDQVSSQQNFNITWSFRVKLTSQYLVRLHFCDIVSDGELYFNVYMGDALAEGDLNLFVEKLNLEAPYYADFVVAADASRHINISIGPSEKVISANKRNAILNGVEMMRLNNELQSLQVSTTGSQKLAISVIVGLALGGVLGLLLLLVAAVLLVLKRQRIRTIPPNPTIHSGESLQWRPVSVHLRSDERTNASLLQPTINLALKISFADIQLATENFHGNSLLGSGGFGDVYRGVLKDGARVAVKRGKPGFKQGFREFEAEVMVLSKIRHRHLVSLIGFCDERSEMILVYELMENGPLKNHLYGSDFPCLSWNQRLRICIDAARGLNYLHTGFARPIIHRDVKSANVLLDERMCAKVADFGLSKVFESLDQSHVTTVVRGSFGYLDPDYCKMQHLTEKSDVYSFGVVLLEILCARPVVDPTLPRNEVSLVEWAMGRMKKELVGQIIDPRLVGHIDANCLRKFSGTVEMCLAEQGADRPTMGDVLWNLEYALLLQEMAAQRDKHEVSDRSVSELPLLNVRRLPSSCLELEREDPLLTSRESSALTGSGVLSQPFNSERI
ncbi:hypothetical protein ACLOJK_032246 [Asimina triloba]